MKITTVKNTILAAAMTIIVCVTTANAAVVKDSFIDQAYGAKIISMGAAGASLSDNPENIYLNPASNANIKDFQVKSSYGQYFDNTFTQGSVVVAIPVNGLGVISMAVPAVMVSGIPETVSKNGEFEQNGTFEEKRMAGLLSYSFGFDKFSFGLTAKYIQQELYEESADALGFDFGIIYKGSDLSIGFSLRDIGDTALDWSTGAADKIAMSSTLGISYDKTIDGLGIVLAADMTSSDSNSYISCGGELSYEGLSLRAGASDRSGEMEVAYGVGLDLGGVEIEYSMKNNEDLGNITKMSLGLML